MALHNGVVLDLTGLLTGSLATAGRAIAQVQMCLASGRSVIAVVSPSAERAGRDLAAANRLPATADASERAAAVVLGAADAAGTFAAVLGEAGIEAAEAGEALWPVTRGHALDAEPRRVSASGFRAALAEGKVLVVPGGVGHDEDGHVTSLGAGTGSLTALFLGERLGLPVERPTERDPVPDDRGAVGERKAARFAERTGTAAEPVGLATPRRGRVAVFGAERSAGSGGLLEAWRPGIEAGFEIERFAGDALGAEAARAWGPDIVIDLAGSADASYELASWALRTGRTVISANTALLAERGGGLGIAALIGGGTLRASGAIRGCPALAPVLARSAGWPGVRRVQGSFSPLGDRVLDLRAQGLSEEEAERAAAAELGLGPADIAAARTGADAMSTLAAVAQLAFGVPAEVRAMPRGPEHVSDLDLARARTQGRRYRVVATAERVGEHIALRVGPVPLREDDPLVNVGAGAVEALVETRDGGSARASGRLQHPGSVAAAVLRDLIESRREVAPALARHATPSRPGVEPTLGATA